MVSVKDLVMAPDEPGGDVKALANVLEVDAERGVVRVKFVDGNWQAYAHKWLPIAELEPAFQ